MTSIVWFRVEHRRRARTAAWLVCALVCLVPGAGTIAAQATGPTKGRPGPINVKGTPDLVVSLAMGITAYRLASTCTAANPLLTFFLQVANRGTGPSPAQPAAMLVAEDIGLSPPWTGQAALPAIDPGKVVSVTLPVMMYSPAAAVTGTDTFTFAVRGASSFTRGNAGTPPVMLVLTIPPGLCTSAPGQRPAPGSPPPGSTTQVKRRMVSKKLNATEMAAIASRFSASEFRTQVLKSGKIMTGPLTTVSHALQAQTPFQLNKIPPVPLKGAQSAAQLKNIPEAEGYEVKLAWIPSTYVTLVQGRDPGCGSWPSVWGCPMLTTSMSPPTPPDSMFPGRTAAVTRIASGGSGWSQEALDVFSFARLAPGFYVSRVQMETQDLSKAMVPVCTAQFPQGYTNVSVHPPFDSSAAVWDEEAKAVKVHLGPWTCTAYSSFWGEVAGSSAADYAITVWVMGPKGKSPWGDVPPAYR